MTGRFIAVVGPSGVGKDTVMEAMAAADPRLGLVRRVITRPSASGGEVFEGVTAPVFHAMEESGAFALSWGAHGLHYGIPAVVDQDLASGRDMLGNLSRSVLNEAKARFPSLQVICLTARADVLADRLAARGREDREQIAKRLTRNGAALPNSIPATVIDNSGLLTETVTRAINALYPVRV